MQVLLIFLCLSSTPGENPAIVVQNAQDDLLEWYKAQSEREQGSTLGGRVRAEAVE